MGGSPRCRVRSFALRAGALALLLGLTSCAFANPANRPVWNAFEDNLVPESDGAFWATLPLTVPVGVVAILVDTFIAHPLQVVDDAWDDTVSLWTELPFDEEYYTCFDELNCWVGAERTIQAKVSYTF